GDGPDPVGRLVARGGRDRSRPVGARGNADAALVLGLRTDPFAPGWHDRQRDLGAGGPDVVGLQGGVAPGQLRAGAAPGAAAGGPRRRPGPRPCLSRAHQGLRPRDREAARTYRYLLEGDRRGRAQRARLAPASRHDLRSRRAAGGRVARARRVSPVGEAPPLPGRDGDRLPDAGVGVAGGGGRCPVGRRRTAPAPEPRSGVADLDGGRRHGRGVDHGRDHRHRPGHRAVQVARAAAVRWTPCTSSWGAQSEVDMISPPTISLPPGASAESFTAAGPTWTAMLTWTSGTAEGRAASSSPRASARATTRARSADPAAASAERTRAPMRALPVCSGSQPRAAEGVLRGVEDGGGV